MTEPPLAINGWTIFVHPLFLDQVEKLAIKVEAIKKKDPEHYARKNAAKRLAAIMRLTSEIIPQNPQRKEYRQGGTLGANHKHWFRAVFFQQYRLFFRFHATQKIIVYAWVNDEGTLRAYESKKDAYRVFEKMLESGNPPDDWEQLLAEAKAQQKRFHGLFRGSIDSSINDQDNDPTSLRKSGIN